MTSGAAGPDRDPRPGRDTLRSRAGDALATPELATKFALVADLAAAAHDLDTGGDRHDLHLHPVDRPGLPDRPVLVAPRDLRRRGVGSTDGRIAAVHALTHIEVNATNLALDHVHRFADLPDDYYRDWIAVAADEARHATALADRLGELGAAYGDLPAHSGLWDMAIRTAGDPLRRMALVPMVFEARGLDVTPPMIERFRHHGDARTADVLVGILADEIGHVTVGMRWFSHLCRAAGRDPGSTLVELVTDAGLVVAGPLNVDARRTAGFSDATLAALAGTSAGRTPLPGA